MNVNGTIISAIGGLGYPVTPNMYDGSSTTYFTFNCEDDRAELFADDEPVIDVASMQIHLFCPGSFNYKNLIKQARIGLMNVGFTYPQITELYESDTKMNHIILSCEISGESETEV